jgi:putative endonuclease
MNASRMRYFIYILASRYKGTLYIGVTRDLSRRAGEHKGGFVPGLTKTYKVHQLVYYENTHRSAKREHASAR